jgi:hypothetical protein
MYFIKCFKKHKDHLSFCDKKGELFGCLGILVVIELPKGSLLVFLLA